ncbi:MAG: AI-2E family transporter [Patescibacteria group bacterium]
MSDRFFFEITWASLWRIFIFSIFAVILYLASDILLVLAAAIIFSSALDPFVSFLERKRVYRIIGTLAVFLVFFLILGLAIYVLAPIFIYEFSQMAGSLNKITSELFGLGIPKNILSQINLSAETVFKFVAAQDASLFDFATGFIGNAVLVIIGVIITFYLTLQKNGVEDFLKAVLPQRFEEVAVDIYNRVKKKIGRWLQAQIFLSLMIGLMVSISLWFLGVKYSLALGFVAAILELFPFIGPIFAGTAAALTAFSDSPMLAVYTILTFIVIQQLESHLLIPTVMSRAVGLNPVIVIISMLIGSKLIGFLGLVLAVPAAVLAQEIIENWSRRKSQQPNLHL